MSVAGAFDFMDAYKKLAPGETRETYKARKEAHEALLPSLEDDDRFLALLSVAFGIPSEPAVDLEWFADEVKGRDDTFAIRHDKAEAALIASLLLREGAANGSARVRLGILTAACGGARTAADPDLAAETLRLGVADASEPLASENSFSLAFPELEDRTEEWGEDEDGTATPASIAGDLSGDVQKAGQEFARRTVRALEILRRDNLRLAAETDMLWWALGDWSETLGRERKKVGFPAAVCGIELAGFVRSAPGPHGAAAVLRRALGTSHDTATRLASAVAGLRPAELAKLPTSSLPLPALFPIHAAISIAHQKSEDPGGRFTQVTGLDAGLELTNHQIALQAYRERILLGLL